MRVGLLGGSFDPVHKAHLALARAALVQEDLDRVYFVLARQAPLKAAPTQTPPSVRLALLRSALRGEPRFRPAAWELRRRGASYTIDTLRAYHRRRPHDEVFFILGSDSLKMFPSWKEPRAILDLATLLVGRRPGAPARIPGWARKRVRFLKGRFPAVSSTAARGAFSRGRSAAALLPRPVLAEIRRRQLYGAA